MKQPNRSMILSLIASIGVFLSLTTFSASANDGIPRFAGAAELSAGWWQWQDANFGPGNFDFGEGLVDCGVGQRGEIWYLGGQDGFAGVPAQRDCIDPIPRGKRLFFPLINIVVWDEPLTVAERRQLADGILSDIEPGLFSTEACKLSIAVDGEPVIFTGTAIERVQSPLFEYDGDPEAVSDGFWVLLPKLSRGDHTIQFSSSLCTFGTGESIGFNVDVTYNLTITGNDD